MRHENRGMKRDWLFIVPIVVIVLVILALMASSFFFG